MLEPSLDRYYREISRYPMIDREEEVRLARGIRRGENEALDKLVRSNLRFVVTVSRKYRNQGVPLPDLISEGNLGLIQAARRFDETRGIRFISYAVWWIRQAILQALAEQGRIVRLPAGRAHQLQRVARHRAELAQELGREPRAIEIAKAMGARVERVEQALAIMPAHLSLDAPVVDGESATLLDSLPDLASPGPEETLFERALSRDLAAALETLSGREATVLRMYFGLGGAAPQSLQEIGCRLGITRERVRQIKEHALHRLRCTPAGQALESFAS